jgi:hypothetical protein
MNTVRQITLVAGLALSLILVATSIFADPAPRMSLPSAQSPVILVQKKPSCAQKCNEACRGKHAQCIGICMSRCK